MSEDYLDIQNYSFQKDIGEGNFGKVKLGIFKPTGEEFAIKILNKNKIKIKMKNSIFKENEIITRFNHINVVYVFQILEDSQNFYIIMEYCKHGELFDYIVKNEKLPEEEASIFFYQLINGIEYIHSRGISHRDLKPENLLLAENKILKIIDFGLSHEFEGEELLKTKCGSPSYAAPEIICCPFYDGFKVDIWCCGIILYAMLCGYLPFEGEDNNILFQNILNCNPEFPSFLSELSKDIILQILTPDPYYRISIDEIKKHEFYLKGKKLCNLDYDFIENDIIKKRGKISRNYIDNKNDTNLNDNNNKEIKNDKYFLTINNNNIHVRNHDEEKNKKKMSLISLDKNNNTEKSKNKNNSSTKNLKNNSSAKVIKKKMTEINYKFAKRIDTITNQIQKTLKTEINENNKVSLRPFSSHKNIQNINFKTNINNNINGKKNMEIALHNTNSNNFYNQKDNNLAFTDLISENKDNKNIKKNDLFFKVLDSTKNKYFHLYNDKLGFIKYDINKMYSDKNKNINNKKKKNDNGTLINHLNTHFPKNNNDINSLDHFISLSNDNNDDNEKYQKTFNNKNNQRINIFKEPIKTEKTDKIKGKPHCFTINNALSKYDKNIDTIINNLNLKSPKDNKRTNSQNSSSRVIKTKPLNLYVPSSTLYYNNININIKEVNINPKLSKNTKHIISTLVNTQKIKSPFQPKKYNNFPNSENRKNIKNKAFSAKRLFSYSINTNNIDNFKTNVNKMDNYNNDNLYTISNNTNNRHFFINTIATNENNNRKMRNYKNKVFGLSKNIRLVYSEKNFNLFKNGRILTTEPKELLKKQFSFSKALTNKNKDNFNSDIKDKYIKNRHKRSNTERMHECNTINTESGRTRFKNTSKLKMKQYGHINGIHPDLHNKIGKYNIVDEMILNKYKEQKQNNKLMNQNKFKKWN